ncbi:Os12g0539150 [Oryza sativa Japonica Group]|uniref:Os12g0539150 protein n=1 Tax=Oryza sativa subsp. japonica TaxID=39947 RepID=A0A0P0YB39_ORYSJ|nr:Os12g0539150 [Oryza sativa Japonica Group]
MITPLPGYVLHLASDDVLPTLAEHVYRSVRLQRDTSKRAPNVFDTKIESDQETEAQKAAQTMDQDGAREFTLASPCPVGGGQRYPRHALNRSLASHPTLAQAFIVVARSKMTWPGRR